MRTEIPGSPPPEQIPEAERKYRFTHRLGRRLLAFALVLLLLGGTALAWAIQIRDLHRQYVGTALEYASRVTNSNTGYLEQSALERAWRVLTRAVGKPKTFEEFETFASLCIARGEYTQGAAYMQSCIDLYAGESNTELAMLWLRKGSLCMLSEENEPAMECLNRALALDGTLADAYLLRAQMRSEQGEPEKAAEDLRIYESYTGNQPVIEAALGGLYESIADYETAVKCYTEAISSGEYDIGNLASRGRCRILTGDSAGALLDLERFFQEGGKDTTGDIYAMLGMCRMEREQYAEALLAFHSALDMNYSEPKLIWSQCVACAYISGDYDTVIADGKQAVAAAKQYGGTKGEIGELYQWIGLSYFIKNEFEPAAEAFENALQNDPTLAYLPYYAGICFMSAGDSQKAIDYFAQSADRGEYASVCLYNSGLCAIQMEDYESAAQVLKRAIEIADDEEAAAQAGILLPQVMDYLKEVP